jgi:hypothetical protein
LAHELPEEAGLVSSFAIAGVLVLKFALPLLILRYPFQASLANYVLDTVDGDVLMPLGLAAATYQTWDKAADWVTYVAMFFAGRRWEIRRTITVLFAFRSVGQLLYFATGNDLFFFFFPNFLEPLFLIYSFLRFRDERTAHERYRRHWLLVWSIVVVYKMWNEWNIHVAEIDLSEFFFG